MSQPNGVIVYRGPSMLDGSPIVCIITGINKPSHNPKTGKMAQVWILPESVAPHVAVATRQDGGVCPSSCQQWQDGSCYVATFQGPRSVYEAMHRGNYPLITLAETKQLATLHNLRLGAWGDVSALKGCEGVSNDVYLYSLPLVLVAEINDKMNNAPSLSRTGRTLKQNPSICIYPLLEVCIVRVKQCCYFFIHSGKSPLCSMVWVS